MSKRSIPELSIDTQTLERELAAVVVGDTIAYDDLTAVIGRNVQNGAAHLLQTARRRLQRERQIVFEPVHGEGLKRLDDIGIASSGESARVRMHNLARRTRQKLGCVQDFDALPNDVKIKHNVAMSIFGALSEVTRSASIKKLEGHVANGKHDALPTAKFLDAMKASI